MNKNKTILELAKEHQLKCFMGRHHITGKAHKYRYKEVNCVLCKRKMDVPDFEHPPYYCWKCDHEAEAALR